MNNKPSPSAFHLWLALAAFGLGIVWAGATSPVYAQKISKIEIEQGRDMLRKVKSEVNDNCYDSSFHGMDTDERLAGYIFDHDIKIADLKGRKELKPMMAKGHGDQIPARVN
jgi:hypothetical protein